MTSHSHMEMSQLPSWNFIASSVFTYLKSNPKILDKIILSLSTQKIQYLLHIQEIRWNSEKSSRSVQGSRYDIQKRQQLASIKIQSQYFSRESRHSGHKKLLFDASDVLANTFLVDWFSLYLPCNNNMNLYEYNADGSQTFSGPVDKGSTVSAEAAFLCETLMVRNLPKDGRYPKGVGHPERAVHNVLSIPVVLPSGEMLCVIELCRNRLKKPFTKHDIVIANWFLGWMSCSLHQASKNKVLDIHSKLNDLLLGCTNEEQSNTHGKVSIDHLVEKILLFGKTLVHADRCAMFLVNEDHDQLYADHFYEYFPEGGKRVFHSAKRVRFSHKRGIAGHVYTNGKTVNISNVYDDDRFDPEVDEITGYHMKNMICTPIINRRDVVGIIAIINSLEKDHFTNADINTLKHYVRYCAVVLHNSRIQNELRVSKKQCNVTLKIFQYHIVMSGGEPTVANIKKLPNKIPRSIFDYDFKPYLYERQLPQLFCFMVIDIFGTETFEVAKISRFVHTVMQNYKPLAYHNWMHGFQVAHAIYCMIKTNGDIFTTQEAMALLIAGVCHDIDHRAYGSVFSEDPDLTLADLYGTSVMTEYSYDFTVTILQLEGHDIFSFLPPYEYRDMLLMISEAITASDLSHYYNNQTRILQMMKNRTFDINNDQCRRVLKALMMTAADLSSAAMQWDTQEDLVTRICDEFSMYKQTKRRYSLKAIDLNYEDKSPQEQVDFLLLICKPLYTTVVNILPGTKPLLEGTMSNLANWQKVADEKERQRMLDESIVFFD
ncbi:cAMP and cAMP-inhibited cGMP 3',5'-cyclic phosphodiesterase 10A-like [Gigantopelta aegis]|uniref:cAMP and cAMP-inhibited cGMP 3',5'-cyclic phosphodiesterase 10A-like n=1 Tax=Gigantopelta aegis TaxID=1735272 RepID=UPI001B889911|nr:cAMP and cAMP-inhibited cGMP 3',5'-cyclic phosphodiesterase 10A-like [Gigantopelta aegis]